MKKKALVVILSVVIVFQLAVPLMLIREKYDIMMHGNEYYFRVSAYSVGKKIRFDILDVNYSGQSDNTKYGVITVNNDGFAEIAYLTNEKPSEPYITSKKVGEFKFPISYFKLNTKAYDSIFHRINESDSVIYIKVAVKDGKVVLDNMYVGDKTISEYLSLQ